jgi:DNA mismatch endonuclease (patch repair protein)
MTDVHDRATRSRNMAAVRGKNTKPELLIRKGLFREGFRFRLHDRWLPGRPDIVLPKHKAVIQIHGCFWHGHDCELFRWPASRESFWRAKIGQNQVRDEVSGTELGDMGWRVLTIWECALRTGGPKASERAIQRTVRWLRSGRRTGVVRGRRVNHGNR